MPPLPTLTPEQRAAALEKSAAARREQSAALAELKAGTLALPDFLATDNLALRRVKVTRVLRALPGVGPVKAARLMEQAQIDSKRRVGGLGSVQRATLADLLAA